MLADPVPVGSRVLDVAAFAVVGFPWQKYVRHDPAANDMLSSLAEGSQSSIFRIWKVHWRYPGLLENALSLERNDGRAFGGM